MQVIGVGQHLLAHGLAGFPIREWGSYPERGSQDGGHRDGPPE